MPATIFTKKNIAGAIFMLIVIVIAGIFFFSLDPVSAAPAHAVLSPMVFQISPGDGFRTIAETTAFPNRKPWPRYGLLPPAMQTI